MNKMREKFESLEKIAGIFDGLHPTIIWFCEQENKYASSFEGFQAKVIWLNGAWYAFQEQQKKIDREWTDIKDKLPPFDNDGARPCYRLLVSLTHGTVTEVSYWGKGEFYLNGSLVEGVKYWMLLPNSPI